MLEHELKVECPGIDTDKLRSSTLVLVSGWQKTLQVLQSPSVAFWSDSRCVRELPAVLRLYVCMTGLHQYFGDLFVPSQVAHLPQMHRVWLRL